MRAGSHAQVAIYTVVLVVLGVPVIASDEPVLTKCLIFFVWLLWAVFLLWVFTKKDRQSNDDDDDDPPLGGWGGLPSS